MKALSFTAAALVLCSIAGIVQATDASSTHSTPAPDATGTPAGDALAASPGNTPLSPLIARLTKGMTDVKTFQTPNGMIGVIAKGKGKPIMMYVDPRGKMVVYGLGFDLVKNALLGADLVQAEFNVPAGKLTAPASVSAPADKISGDALARLKDATYIETVSGSGRGPVIYAFVEPNCIWCRRAWPALSTAQKTPGSLLANATIRWIPLAFSDGASQQVLAALHSGADGFEKLNLLFNPTTPIDAQKDPDYKKVTANLALFSSLGDTGTPTFYALSTPAATSGKRIEGWGGLELFRQ